MSVLSDTIATLLSPDGPEYAAVGNLMLISYPVNGVLNVDTVPRTRALTSADIDEVRAALTDAGYHEIDAWVASQGGSWLTADLFAGVSFRIRRAS